MDVNVRSRVNTQPGFSLERCHLQSLGEGQELSEKTQWVREAGGKYGEEGDPIGPF